MSGARLNHIVYWTIPQVDAGGAVVSERHFAVNLAELGEDEAAQIESMLRAHRTCPDKADDPRSLRTDPGIIRHRALFQPFMEVKKRAVGLCRFSSVWLPYYYAEFTQTQGEPRPEPAHHTHPSVHPLAGAG